MLCTAEGNYYILSDTIAEKILPLIEGILAKTNLEGTHPVNDYAGIHFKITPDAPGIEFAIDSLNKLLTNQGSTPRSSDICLPSGSVPGKREKFRLDGSRSLDKPISLNDTSCQLTLATFHFLHSIIILNGFMHSQDCVKQGLHAPTPRIGSPPVTSPHARTT